MMGWTEKRRNEPKNITLPTRTAAVGPLCVAVSAVPSRIHYLYEIHEKIATNKASRLWRPSAELRRPPFSDGFHESPAMLEPLSVVKPEEWCCDPSSDVRETFEIVRKVVRRYGGRMKKRGGNVFGRLLGPALALLALVVFGVTLSRYAYPGQSASMIVQYGDMFPLLSPNLPLWGWLFRVVWSVPLGDAVVRVNALSAVFGAAGIWLLYHVVSTGIAQLVNPSDLSEHRGMVLARIAGIAAALALCFSSPYWIVATRAHNATFDTALLLGATAILVAYMRSGRLAWLYTLAFVWGIGTVEYASFIIFAPLVLVGVLLLMWQKGQLRALPVISASACGLLGLSLYLVAAWNFYGTEGYEFREYPSYFKVVWFMWRDQYRLITASLPREGWLIIILTTGVPWVAGLSAARRGINDAPEWSDYFLNLVLSLVCGLVLLNLKVSPWAMLGHARLLVMPYVLTAALTGYLVAYWLRQVLGWGETPATKFRAIVIRGSAVILAVALVGVVGAAPIRNFAGVDSRSAAVLSRCAELVLDSALQTEAAPEGAWIIADGVLDDQIRIAAFRRREDVKVVNLRGADSESYRKHLASLFESPRLQNMARVGISTLMRELFGGDDSIRDRAVVFGVPDLWLLADYQPVSDRLTFVGCAEVVENELPFILERHQTFWDSTIPQLRAASVTGDVPDPLSAVAQHLLRHCSMVANNLGVLLEDKGMAESAFNTYAQAAEIFPDNVSAILNMVRMINAGYETDGKNEVMAAFEELKEGGRMRRSILALSVLYGYVREPKAFTGIARTWALTGQPHMAAESFQKALSLVDADQQGGIKQDLASLYLDQERDEESEALFYELLVEDPENHKALMGLARIMAREQEFDEARSLLKRAHAAGVPSSVLAIERAAMAVMQSDDATARKELEALIREEEGLTVAWRLLVDILIRAQDWRALERAAERLRSLQGGVGLEAEVRAVLSLQNADLRSARRYFSEALNARPNDLPLLQRVLRLELMARNLDLAEGHARTILQLDGDNALANFVIGASRMATGETVLAEEALRRSISGERIPEALNDLAWLLLKKGDYAEAETLAEEVTKLRPEMHQAWDTLGKVLLQQQRLPEAEEALQKALSLTQDSVDAFLHMAQLQAAKGDKEHAREILLMIAGRTDRLSSEAKQEYETLQRSLGDG